MANICVNKVGITLAIHEDESKDKRLTVSPKNEHWVPNHHEQR